ncbi:MAG: branched-chain amino acid ABC transporter permease [Bdellovibrionales bacterium]|nr:branched-chain amino acid ABC transporter permease [Bdellovibrionales bacterium]
MWTYLKRQQAYLILGVFLVVLSFIHTHISPYLRQLLILSGINIILANGLNLISGITGQLSLGHAGFMAIGAYASAYLSVFVTGPESFAFLLNILAGGCLAGFFGFILGLPTLRLKGDYLAIVTLGFSEMIRVILLNMDSVGGARGLPQIPHNTDLIWTAGAVGLSLIFIYRMMKSYIGRAFLAIRENELAAQSCGINITKYKVISFTSGAFLAGIAGALFAHQLSYINPSIFGFIKSFEILIMIVLGGLGSLSGATLAAIILTFLPEALRPLQQITQIDFRMIIYSSLLIVMMLTRPSGLLGKRELWDFKIFGAFRRS